MRPILLFLFAALAFGQVRKSGELAVFTHCAVDLDEGQCDCVITLDGPADAPPVHPSGKQFEFRLEPCGTGLCLAPRNGATLSRPGTAELSLDACRAETYSKAKAPLQRLAAGAQLCVHTTDGRYAMLRPKEAVTKKGERAVFTYTTWEPVDPTDSSRP